MANNLQTFNSMQFGKLRTVEVEGEIYFVGKDVATILGYARPADAIAAHVDVEDKLTRQFTDSGQMREMTIINESGLYSLIFSSKLPKAKAFKRWVTADVLPMIRKHGSYNHRTPVANAVEDVGLVAENIQKIFPAVHHGMALTQAINLVEENASINLDSLRPLLPAAEHKTGYMNATMLGQKLGGLKARSVNKLLAANGFQYKESDGTWRLTEEGAAFGEEKPYGNLNSGHYGYQILWSDGVIDKLECRMDNDANNLSIDLR